MMHLKNVPRPPREYRASEVVEWPVLGNDKLPCCTCAAAAHMIHHWSALRQKPVLLDEQTVLGTFLVVSNGTEQPVEMLHVLRFWRHEGIAQRKSRSFVAIDAKDPHMVKTAIHLFGAAYVGLEFPDFVLKDHASMAIDWVLPRGGAVGKNAPNPENGHCVAAVGYTPNRLFVVSCGQLRSMSWSFYKAYADEGYGVLSEEWYGEDRVSPNGINLHLMEDEIRELRERKRAEAEGAALQLAAAAAQASQGADTTLVH